ncbi:hypothetical protein ANCDUO_01796 [Ancylostoma duodenale]|uniref:Uncharacterized protein n=1 Tax=Ancylostoma duodenale TaxID=51022 RepID=A0A0C2H8H9_9BILA|nr:hypothetical protein ANCDUO_01796 [Ancylostoma duodenale]
MKAQQLVRDCDSDERKLLEMAPGSVSKSTITFSITLNGSRSKHGNLRGWNRLLSERPMHHIPGVEMQKQSVHCWAPR